MERMLCIYWDLQCTRIFLTVISSLSVKQGTVSDGYVFIFKMGFGMSFHFQNVVLFQNLFSFSKCERFREVFFFLFPKNTIVNKTVTTNSFTEEVVLKNTRNIYKAFKFVSVVKNLLFIISDG